MLIDNTLRKRWGLIPNQVGSNSEDELVIENDLTGSIASNLESPHRYRVSAEEWLITWRAIE